MRAAFFLIFLVILDGLHAEETNSAVHAASLRPDPWEVATLQIALDNMGFSPGVVDNSMGEKTRLAAQLAKEAGRSITPMTAPWQSWNVPADIAADIAPLPDSWLDRSRLARLGFESMAEKIAERFHLSEAFLAELNPHIKDWTRLPEGTALRVPSLVPRRLEKASCLRIGLSQKIIIALDAGNHPLASFPCSIAAKKEKRPVGSLTVRVLAPNPDYLFDPAVFPEVPEAATLKSKLMISPGPNNPVGEMWIGLSLKGYGIHGTPHPEEIGKTESHGCFRLANWDARRLAAMLRIGTPVLIEE